MMLRALKTKTPVISLSINKQALPLTTIRTVPPGKAQVQPLPRREARRAGCPWAYKHTCKDKSLRKASNAWCTTNNLLLNGRGLLLGGRHFGVCNGTKGARLILFWAYIWICNKGVVARAQMTNRDFTRNHSFGRMHIVAPKSIKTRETLLQNHPT